MKQLNILFVAVLLYSAVSIVYADVNEELLEAAKDGDLETVQTLIDKGADVNAKDNLGWTVLMFASLNGYTDTVKLLINKGADINAENNEGKTALMRASTWGYKDIVELLKQAGAKE